MNSPSSIWWDVLCLWFFGLSKWRSCFWWVWHLTPTPPPQIGMRQSAHCKSYHWKDLFGTCIVSLIESEFLYLLPPFSIYQKCSVTVVHRKCSILLILCFQYFKVPYTYEKILKLHLHWCIFLIYGLHFSFCNLH